MVYEIGAVTGRSRFSTYLLQRPEDVSSRIIGFDFLLVLPSCLSLCFSDCSLTGYRVDLHLFPMRKPVGNRDDLASHAESSVRREKRFSLLVEAS
jgi:hypothetical protein